MKHDVLTNHRAAERRDVVHTGKRQGDLVRVKFCDVGRPAHQRCCLPACLLKMPAEVQADEPASSRNEGFHVKLDVNSWDKNSV